MKKIKTTVNRFSNSSLHEKALTNAIKLLNAIGVEYAIQDHDGSMHGNGVLHTKQKKASPKYPYGTLAKHIRPYIDACRVNQTVTIPIGHFDLLHVYGSASSAASKHWGNGCHKIGTSVDKKAVLLTRTEKIDDMDDLFAQLGIN